jgi:hypothetical protein
MAQEADIQTNMTDLLFVHKFVDSSSLTHSRRAEKHSIASHVQSWRRRQKVKAVTTRQGKSKQPLKAKPESIEATSSPGHEVSLPLILSEAALSDTKSPPAVLNRTRSVHPGTHSLNLPEKTLDPFDASAVRLDEQAHMLLQYYIKVIFPSRFHAETRIRPAVKHQFDLAEQEVVRECLRNELHMITLLASSASRMQYMEKVPVQNGTDVYMQRALRALRLYVDEGPVASIQLVFDIYHLFTAEAYRFNNAAAKVHLKAAKVVVDQLGGQGILQKINPHLVETLAIGDLFVAAEDLSAPVFGRTFDPGFGTARLLRLETGLFRTQMGLRLLHPSQTAIVDAQTYQIVKEIIECVKIAVSTSEMPDPRSKALRWLHRRNLGIRHHLLSMTPEDPRTAALHAALQMWILCAFTRMGPVRTTKVMAPKLEGMLSKMTWQDWKGHEDIYAWILSIGAIASRETPLEPWFVEKMVIVMPGHFDLSTFEQLRQFSDQFFYLHSIQRPWLERLAEKLDLMTSSVKGVG